MKDNKVMISPEEQKNIMVQILTEFDSFCRKNGIKYFLAGGTLLGAVRHKGFIPWDDDVDVFMLREDYDRLLKLYVDTDKYVLKTFEKDTNYYYPFAKLVDNSTVLIENVVQPIEMGLYLDIFPLDNCPGDYDSSCKYLKKILKYRHIKNFKEIRFSKKRSFFKNCVLFAGKAACAPFTFRIICICIDRLSKRYKEQESEYVGQLTNNCYGNREIHKKEAYKSSIELEFEGHHFMAPAEYDYVLKTTYGDYMKLPPVEKRISTHNYDCWYKNVEEK